MDTNAALSKALEANASLRFELAQLRQARETTRDVFRRLKYFVTDDIKYDRIRRAAVDGVLKHKRVRSRIYTTQANVQAWINIQPTK
jgi:hypothetical protein